MDAIRECQLKQMQSESTAEADAIKEHQLKLTHLGSMQQMK